jgi:hypothetical protein
VTQSGGSFTIGNGSVSAKIVNPIAVGDINADINNAYDIGSPATKFRGGYFSTSLVVGTNPAATGALRLANANFVVARNAANSADVNIIGLNASDHHRIDFATQTTIGANGAASALTANPVGYIVIDISGTERIIPFYTK